MGTIPPPQATLQYSVSALVIPGLGWDVGPFPLFGNLRISLLQKDPTCVLASSGLHVRFLPEHGALGELIGAGT